MATRKFLNRISLPLLGIIVIRETAAEANRFFLEIDGCAHAAVLILGNVIPLFPLPKGGRSPLPKIHGGIQSPQSPLRGAKAE